MPVRSVLIVKNITREGPGMLTEILAKNNIATKIVDLSQGEHFPSPGDFAAVVVLGGPDSANDHTAKMQEELTKIRECLDSGIPYLGICLGMQTLVKAAGGDIIKSPTKEVGFMGPDNKPFTVSLTDAGKQDPFLKGLLDSSQVFHLHGETVKRPENVALLGSGDFVENQIVKVGSNAYGIQSHFELTTQMLDQWIQEDPDLASFKPEELKAYFAKVSREYTQTAWTLFTNFLKIANL